MGNNSTKQPQQYEIVSSYNNRHWFLKDHLKDCDIWENKLLNIPAEAYKIPQNKSSQELERYTFRNINNKDIVGIYHIIYQEKQFLCSTTTTMIVLTQRIPIRLNGLQRLTESEALTVLRSAYSGLNTIGAHYGPVKINEDCIGFTDDGKCKVWVNSNFSINQPLLNDMSTIQNTEKLNFVRVMEVFNMVDNKTDKKCLSELKNIFNEKEPTYFEAINLIDIYCERKNLIITERINQIVVNNLFLVDRQIVTDNYANFNNSTTVNFKPIAAKPTSLYTFQSQNNTQKMLISQPKNLTINMNWKSPTNTYSTYKPSQFFNSKPLYTPQNKTTNISFNYKPVPTHNIPINNQYVPITNIPLNNQYNFNRVSAINNKINNQIQNQPQQIEINKISTNPEQISTKQIKTKEENNFKIENQKINSVSNTNLKQNIAINQEIEQKQITQIKLNQQNPIIQNQKSAEEVIQVQQKNKVQQNNVTNIESVSKTITISQQQTKQTSQLKEQLKPVQKQQNQIKQIENDNQVKPISTPPVNTNKNQQQMVKRRNYRERITKQQNTQPQIIEENESNSQIKTNWRKERQVQNNKNTISNKRQQYQYRRTEQQQPRQYTRTRFTQDKQPQSTNFHQQIVNRVSTQKYSNQQPNRNSRRRRRYQPEPQQKTYERPYSRQYKSRSRSNRYSRQEQNNQRPQRQSREEQNSQRRKYRRNRQPEENNSKYSRSYQQSQVREISEEDLNNAPRFGTSRQRQQKRSDIGDGRVKYSRAESIRQIKRLNEERKVLLKEREQIIRDGQLINYQQDESPAPKFGGQYNKQAQRQKELLSLNRSATEEIFSNINADEKEQPSQIFYQEDNRNKEENNLKTEQIEDQKQVIDLSNKPSQSDKIDISKKLSTGVIEEEEQRPENLRDYEEYIRRKHNVPKYDRNTKTFSVSSSQKLSKAQSKEDINYDPASHSVHYQGVGNYQKGQNGIQIGSSDPIEQHPSGHHNTMTFMPKDRAAKKKQNEKLVDNVRVQESRVDKLIDSEKNDTIINSVQSSQKHKVYTTQNFRRMDDGLGEQYTNIREQYGPNGFKSTTTTSYKYSSRGNLPQLKSIQSKYHKQIPTGQGQVVRSRHQKYIQTKTAMSTYDPQPFNSNSGIKKNKELINMNEELRNIF